MSNVLEFKKPAPKLSDYVEARNALNKARKECMQAHTVYHETEKVKRCAEVTLEQVCSHQGEQVCGRCYYGGPRGYRGDYHGI